MTNKFPLDKIKKYFKAKEAFLKAEQELDLVLNILYERINFILNEVYSSVYEEDIGLEWNFFEKEALHTFNFNEDKPNEIPIWISSFANVNCEEAILLDRLYDPTWIEELIQLENQQKLKRDKKLKRSSKIFKAQLQKLSDSL